MVSIVEGGIRVSGWSSVPGFGNQFFTDGVVVLGVLMSLYFASFAVHHVARMIERDSLHLPLLLSVWTSFWGILSRAMFEADPDCCVWTRLCDLWFSYLRPFQYAWWTRRWQVCDKRRKDLGDYGPRGY